MIRKLKVLGLALVAVCAMSAIASASASAALFHSEAENTNISGAQVGAGDVFNTDSGEVKCSEATYSGSQSGKTAETVRVSPKYGGCSAAFGASVTIDPEGCEYVFHSNGTVDVECPEGKVIKVTAPGCTVTVPTQTGLGTATYDNLTETNGKKDIRVTVHLSGIRYIEHQGLFLHTCAHSETKETTNGTYHGEATVTGFDASTGLQTNIWWE